MPLYSCQPPTGYKDTADAWVNTGALVGRMNFALDLASNKVRRDRRRQPRALPTAARRSSDASCPNPLARQSSGRRTLRRRSRWRSARRNFSGAESCRAGDTMISRRVFMKNGAFALVSLGFAPSFLARTAYAQGRTARAKQLIAIFQRGAVDGLSVVVPFGDGEYYRARPSIAIARPRSGDGAAIDLDGFFGFNPRLAAAQAVLGQPRAGHRPRVRIARRDALAFRRAGLHGDGDARRQEHAGWLAEPVSAGAGRARRRRRRRSAPSR